jgi:hypothetical protein
MEAVTAARAAFDAGQLDDAAGLASLMRDATKAIWEAHSDAYEAFTVSEQVRCDREDAKYLAFVARAA